MAHQPGPNDWNVSFAEGDTEKKTPILGQGLGDDEPDEEALLRRHSASARALDALKAEVQKDVANLDARELALNARERAIEEREQRHAIERQEAARAAGEPILEERE